MLNSQHTNETNNKNLASFKLSIITGRRVLLMSNGFTIYLTLTYISNAVTPNLSLKKLLCYLIIKAFFIRDKMSLFPVK